MNGRVIDVPFSYSDLTAWGCFAIPSLINGIAGRCAVDRPKRDQPWTVFMGSADGVRSPVVSLLPNCLWAFPGRKTFLSKQDRKAGLLEMPVLR